MKKKHRHIRESLLVLARAIKDVSDDIGTIHELLEAEFDAQNRATINLQESVIEQIEMYHSDIAGLAGKIDVIFRESKRPPPERG